MPRNVYWELFYHIVWRTKDSLPLIKPTVEPHLRKYLTHRALEIPESMVHAVGGIEDHVHLAVSLPPTVTLAQWIGDIKGASSHEMNQTIARGTLSWQTGYGIVTFGRADLKWVVEYVQNQRQHHAAATAHDRLERITHMDEGAPQGDQSKPVETG